MILTTPALPTRHRPRERCRDLRLGAAEALGVRRRDVDRHLHRARARAGGADAEAAVGAAGERHHRFRARLAHEPQAAGEREVGRRRDDAALREGHHLAARDDATLGERGRVAVAARERALEQRR